MENKKPTKGTIATPKRSFPTYSTNPFMQSTTVKTRSSRTTVAPGGTIIDMSTGEHLGTTEIAQVKQVDNAAFVKVFVSEIRAFFELNQAAYRLLQIVFALTQKHIGLDRVYMNPETLPSDLPTISKTVFYRALSELLEKKFLARVENESHWYFINPSLFFNGDRVRFVREYRRVKATPNDQQLGLPGIESEPIEQLAIDTTPTPTETTA